MIDHPLNLPNYFLADLPPEAALTPGLITEACQTLKRNRARYLEGRTTESLIQCLDGIGRDWLEADYPFRGHALEAGRRRPVFPRRCWRRGWTVFSSN